MARAEVGSTYRHVKGALYDVIALAFDAGGSNSPEKEIVVYREHHGAKTWARPREEFEGHTESGAWERFQLVPRKTRAWDFITAEMKAALADAVETPDRNERMHNAIEVMKRVIEHVRAPGPDASIRDAALVFVDKIRPHIASRAFSTRRAFTALEYALGLPRQVEVEMGRQAPRRETEADSWCCRAPVYYLGNAVKCSVCHWALATTRVEPVVNLDGQLQACGFENEQLRGKLAAAELDLHEIREDLDKVLRFADNVDAFGEPASTGDDGRVEKVLRQLERADALRMDLTAAKNNAYAERNRLVALVSSCFPSSLERDKTMTEPCWGWVVIVDLPAGQVSWHIHDDELPLFGHLARGQSHRVWDGHNNDEKWKRVARQASIFAPQQEERVEPERVKDSSTLRPGDVVQYRTSIYELRRRSTAPDPRGWVARKGALREYVIADESIECESVLRLSRVNA